MKHVIVPPDGFRHVAVLRLSSLGDVILTLPVVHAIRAAWPTARITYWTKEEYADVVRFDPAIAHVRVLERDARRLEDLVSMSAELEDSDLIVDLHGSVRTRVLTLRQKAPVLRIRTERLLRARWVHARWTSPPPAPHALERYARVVAPVGLRPTGPPRVTTNPAAEVWADEWLTTWGEAAPVVICPAAQHFTKQWPEEHWIELIRSLTGSGRAVLAMSLAREREALPRLKVAIEDDPRARWCCEPLDRLAALMSRAAVAITGDTGLMHLAAGRGVRVVALFGSTAPELGFTPAGDGHVVLCRHEPCQPCTLHGRDECPQGHFRCMRLLLPGEVLQAVEAQAHARV